MVSSTFSLVFQLPSLTLLGNIADSPFATLEITYTWQLDSTITTLWCSTSFLDVKVSKGTAWGLDNADLV